MCTRIMPSGAPVLEAHATIFGAIAALVAGTLYTAVFGAYMVRVLHPHSDINLGRAFAGIVVWGIGWCGLLMIALIVLLPHRMWPVIDERLFWQPATLNVTAAVDTYNNSTCCVSVCQHGRHYNTNCVQVCVECVVRALTLVAASATQCMFTQTDRVCPTTDAECIAHLPHVGSVYSHAHISPSDATRVSLEPLQFASADVHWLVAGCVCVATALTLLVVCVAYDSLVPWLRDRWTMLQQRQQRRIIVVDDEVMETLV